MAKIPARKAARKPAKPSKDFPLFAHASGRWAKKIRGRFHYFGPWRDVDGALAKWLDQKDDLLAGRTPRVQGDGLDVRGLANRFLTSKRLLADNAEITERTFQDYKGTAARVLAEFGKTRLVSDLAADDFDRLRAALAKTRGPVALANEVQRVRSIFKFAHDQGLIDSPMRYGQSFRRPGRKLLRQARNAKGPRMFKRSELRAILRTAGPQLRAMVYLGINCGLGNSDVGNLPLAALDLDKGWLRFPRPKTGINRSCPLWPETVKALREAIDKRPEPKDENDAGLVFITKRGLRWAKDKPSSPLSAEMSKVLKQLKIDRPGLNFYALRHGFETIAGDSRDQVAVSYIMGHSPSDKDMSAVYRERVFNHRLYAVAKHVRKWLFAKPKRKTDKPAKAAKSSDEPTLRVHRA